MYSLSLSFLSFRSLAACMIAKTSASNTSLFFPRQAPHLTHPPSLQKAAAAPASPLSNLDPSVHIVSDLSYLYQLLSRHATTAEHLLQIDQAPSNHCWRCGSGERQSRYHLFVKCRRWGPQIRRLWQRIGKGCGESVAPSVRGLFNDARATPAVPEFPEDTRVGRVPDLVLLVGGPDDEEDEMEEIELWALVEE